MRSQKKQKGGYSRVMNSIVVEDSVGNLDERIVEIETEYGPLRVTIEGDIKNNRVFLTYHDIGLNHSTCFRRFFNQARRSDDVFNKFAVVHIDAPGQHEEARQLSDDIPYLDMEVLAAQINKVLERLEIKTFFAFGVGAGAYILGLYVTRNPSRVEGLVFVGAMANSCGWIEWRQKWHGLLLDRFYSGSWKNYFMKRWFSRKTVDSNMDLIEFYSTALDRIQSSNLVKFVHGYQRRKNFTEDLKKIKCRALFFSGEESWQEQETVEVTREMNVRNTEFGRANTGMTVIIEDPTALVEPIRLMLRGMGIW